MIKKIGDYQINCIYDLIRTTKVLFFFFVTNILSFFLIKGDYQGI